ncbi:chloride channel protein CLC-e-like [Silene latifolia]|uniref:chloride channel protein CLC-e-like n=1 Tax=Silene latifolia TaxID=37657 RepID=UPI003D789A8D
MVLMMAGLRLLRFTNGLKYGNKLSSYESHSWPPSRVFVSSLSYKVGRIAASKAPEVEVEGEDGNKNKGTLMAFFNSEDNSALISASIIGILTGFSVVIFNNLVHELRDFFWDGIPYRGASWLREQPLESSWQRIIFVPVFGGFLVSMLNALRDSLDSPSRGEIVPKVKAVLQQFLKSLAACVTLGTGNSLGPEGPSVEIGASIAKGVGTLFGRDVKTKVPLIAAGSAAGIASGFNAAVAGCFFAVESVLWPSPDSAASLTNTTSMVILSAVIASVLSEVGLGAEPAFKVPDYDFRSVTELPLYLLLGILCGVVSLTLTRCTTFMLHTVEDIQKEGLVPKAVFPITGGLAVGLMALAYPEILYWGFQNVDILLESRPFVKGLSADLLFQLVGIKIIATSVCRASGLVGGYYAPSLFIGAATGMAYGKFIAFAVAQSHPTFQISFLEVASPQAYGLVGMAATLAGVCQVPLTSVLLLFELTQDYRIVIPLLGAVGMSSWITSSKVKRGAVGGSKKSNANAQTSEVYNQNTSSSRVTTTSSSDNLCEIESSSCYDDSEDLERNIFVSQAMRTSFATVLRGTLLVEAVTLMLAEKQFYALIVDEDNYLTGMLSLSDILEFSKSEQARKFKTEELSVAELCCLETDKCGVVWTATPNMDLRSAETMMVRHRLSQLPVVDHPQGNRGRPVGVIDMHCIKLAFSAVATKENLKANFN